MFFGLLNYEYLYKFILDFHTIPQIPKKRFNCIHTPRSELLSWVLLKHSYIRLYELTKFCLKLFELLENSFHNLLVFLFVSKFLCTFLKISNLKSDFLFYISVPKKIHVRLKSKLFLNELGQFLF